MFLQCNNVLDQTVHAALDPIHIICYSYLVPRALGWSYVSVVYEDSNYGLKGYAELERAAAKQGICFAYTKRIDFDEPDWGRDKYEEIIRRITKKDRSNGKFSLVLQIGYGSYSQGWCMGRWVPFFLINYCIILSTFEIK